jgi:WD40 repeat protein
MITPMLRHSKVVHAVAFAPDSLAFVSGGADGTARIWKLTDLVPPARELIALAQAISGRRLNGNTGPVPLGPAEIRPPSRTAIKLAHKGGRIVD